MSNIFERLSLHISQRKALRELVENSNVVYARIFEKDGHSSTLMRTSGGLFGIDGMFGTAVEMGIRVDIIGLDKQDQLLGPVKLV